MIVEEQVTNKSVDIVLLQSEAILLSCYYVDAIDSFFFYFKFHGQ